MKLGEILVVQGLVTSADVNKAIRYQKAMADNIIWKITSEHVQSIKEELKGRRAALEARLADALNTIESELDEIATLERAIGTFAAKHLPDTTPADGAG